MRARHSARRDIRSRVSPRASGAVGYATTPSAGSDERHAARKGNMPPALDFPNAPTNGQQYSAPNGVIYTYDGVAWTTSGVLSTGSTAGGSLAGTYPNPSIATGAVRGTPSSGGTQREILKAS